MSGCSNQKEHYRSFKHPDNCPSRGVLLHKLRSESGEEQKIDSNGVFIEIGWLPDTDILDGLIALNEKKEIIVAQTATRAWLAVLPARGCHFNKRQADHHCFR